MKKEVFVVVVDNYMPELCAKTLPTIEAYANKIGAKFTVITKRKFPEWYPTYEKLQVYELGKNNDWNILIDADTFISPELPDVTEIVPATHVGIQYAYAARLVMTPDEYFIRDGRELGISSNFVVTSKLTHDLWTPLDMTPAEARARITRDSAPDEFCLSRNMARFGLKYAGVTQDQSLINHLSVTTDGDKK
jgi:hypothetical protein